MEQVLLYSGKFEAMLTISLLYSYYSFDDNSITTTYFFFFTRTYFTIIYGRMV